MATDLWGVIPGVSETGGPGDVLSEQSEVLKEKTGGLVGLSIRFTDELVCRFRILDKLAHGEPILIVRGVEYPCLVIDQGRDRWAQDNSGFCDILQDIFQSESVRSELLDCVVSALSILRSPGYHK